MKCLRRNIYRGMNVKSHRTPYIKNDLGNKGNGVKSPAQEENKFKGDATWL